MTMPPVVPSPTGAVPPRLDPALHPEAHPFNADQQIFPQNPLPVPSDTTTGLGTAFGGIPPVTTPGMQPLQLPPSLQQLIAGETPQDEAIEQQGLTPDAVAMDEATEQQRQKSEQDSADARKKALKGIYGDDFPLVKDSDPTDADWSRWIEDRWMAHGPGVQPMIWMAERNRQFRAGHQWQSRVNAMGAWRETPIPKDAVRIVDNRIRPALAWAMQVVAEQRPGWQFKPTNTDADRERKADAMQRAVEYQYDAQRKRLIDKESVYWAQTDGVSFQMTYWDPDDGPWEELEAGKGAVPLGEPCTRVFRIEHVRVSSEATSTISPMYWIVRDVLPMQYAVALYGPDVLDSTDQGLLAQTTNQFQTTNLSMYNPLFQNQATVSRYFFFCDKRDWLPNGLTVVTVGHKLVYGPNPLLMGRVPMLRVTDGSEDPGFYPLPKMNLLIAPQMRINMLKSKTYESIRKNAGGRFATKNNAVASETFIGGETSLLEVRTPGPIGDAIQAVQGFSVGEDIKEALADEVKQIEDLTGYTDQARGQFESDQSGRAILAQREALERVFAPQVGALAEANTEWAKQMIGWMRFGYQMPRKIAISGNDRSDLAMELSATDMDGVVDVTVDPETMIPQPMALKQWMLDNAYDRQIINKEQWLERSPFGDVRDMQAPSEIQYQKAKRVSEQLRLGQPAEPVIWQDDESIHQNVLERDLILAGGIEDPIRQAAIQRWQQLAQQASQKNTPPPPAPGTPAAEYMQFKQGVLGLVDSQVDKLLATAIEQMIGLTAPPQIPGQGPQGAPASPIVGSIPRHKPPEGHPMDPHTAPLLGSSPSVAAGPVAAQGGPGVSNQERAAAQFELRQLQ